MFGWLSCATDCASWRKRARKSGSRPYSGRSSLTATSRPGPRLQLDGLEVVAELGAQVRPLQCQLHGGLEPAHRGAGVIARSFERVAVDLLLRHQGVDRVGQLDLAAGTLRSLLELVEDL